MPTVAKREWERVFKPAAVGSGFRKRSLLFLHLFPLFLRAKSRQELTIFVKRHRRVDKSLIA